MLLNPVFIWDSLSRLVGSGSERAVPQPFIGITKVVEVVWVPGPRYLGVHCQLPSDPIVKEREPQEVARDPGNRTPTNFLPSECFVISKVAIL